ncbi:MULTISPECIES: META domain-containing protein [unclassified Streptomyces]|uniref:META domain-containing protein n=1 Tax=unclassified Streptomyces TaxID=2593676 RepID=UPI002E339CC8|nr:MULTISPECIES: META domain-containing protein [unclassified Streptomyces]WUC65451.1 META domain-containing protein [Streptomyces sp. NBC_00539]
MRTQRPALPAALAAVLALVGVCACGAQDAAPRPVHTGTVDGKSSPEPPADAPLTATGWTVTALTRGGAASPVSAEAAGKARFTLAPDGAASGGLGCNRFTAKATVEGASLTFGPIASTRMACAGGAGEVERALTALFGGGPLGWQVHGRTLTLTGADGSGLIAEAASAAE